MNLLRNLVAVLAVISCFGTNAQTWLSGYEFRKEVTITSGNISGTGTLSEFPVIVSITSSDLDNSTAHVSNSSGYDIQFTDGDGSTALAHQLVSYDGGSGAVVAWVKLDLDGTNGNTFYIYYGNSEVTTDQSSADTWNSNYVGVWTLDETSGTAFSDLTVNANDLSDNGGTVNITGKIGNAQNFDGTDDWLQAEDAASLKDITNAFTFSAWVQLDGAQGSDVGIIIKSENNPYNQHLGVETTERPSFRVEATGGTTNLDNSEIDVDLDDDAWHHLVGVYNGTQVIAYVDGTDITTVTTSSGNVETSNEPLLMGRRAIGDNRFYDGDIDEPRYLSVALSADWVATEFTNQDDPANFVSANTEESTTPIDGGNATALDDEIFEGNTTILNLTGNTSGTTFQWQSSTDGVSFADVTGGSGATTVAYISATLTTNTYFRCVVDNGSQSVASTSVLVTVKPQFNSGDGPSGYSLRRKLTIDATEVISANTMVASHDNFPLLVRLTGEKVVSDLIYAGNGGDVAHPNGYDIIFTESDGTTELEHQIEAYDPTTGEYVAWIDIASLSTSVDTEIYMYYGNPDVSADPSDNIFDVDYIGTWHLHNEYDDAVSTGNDGVSFGSVANDEGIIGNGARFSPADDDDFSRIEVGDFDPDPTNITVSAWFNRETNNDGTNDARIISKTDGQAPASHTFMLSLNNGNDIRFRLAGTESDDSGRELQEQTINVDFATGSWVYAAFTYTANGTVIIYEDGVQVGTDTDLNDKEKIEQNSGYGVAIGNNPGPADGGDPTTRKPFDGVIDEVRVASVVRSSDWLLTEYNNQKENSTFCTVDEEEGCDVNGGIVSAVDENIFTGETTVLTTSSSSGTLQWQSSSDNVSFSDIPGANSESYTTSTLALTTYFRVSATSGTCSDVSNVVTVNVQGRFLSSYAYRKEITIDNSKVSGSTALSEFPILISITDPDLATTANGGNVYDTDAGNGTLGDDITFTDESGNELTQYREAYDDATGQLIVWVKIPTLSATSDTKIFIYYGNCTGSGLPNLFNTNSWNNDSNSDDYDAVWLMNDATPTTIEDATSNNRDGTGTGLTASTAGQIDGSIDLEDGDGSDKVTYSSYTSSGSALTVSAWVNPESLLNPAVGADTDDAIILSHSDFELKTFVADLGTDENEFSFEVTTGSGTVAAESLPSDLTAGTFIMVTGVYDGTNVSIYENGNVIASSAQTGNLTGTSSDILVGNNAGNTLPFDGLIDHVTIIPAARTSDWIKTMYNNQSDPSTFYTYNSSNEESQVTWVGGASGDETNFNNPSNWSNCQVPTTSESIILESGSSFYPTLGANTQVEDLIIESGASFSLGTSELTVTGRFTNNGTFTAGTGSVIFAGSSEQQISGSSAITFYDIEVNNGSNEVRAENDVTVSNSLTLTSGFITISNNPFIIESTASIVGGSTSSFVITEGTECLEQEGIATADGDVSFPIGTSSSSYTPVTLNNIGTEDDFCVRVEDNVLSDGSTGTEIVTEVVSKSWYVDESVTGGSDVTLTLQWNLSDELPDFDRSNMYIAHYTSTWENYENGLAATNPSTNIYTASTSNVSSFCPIAVGSGSAPTILPIELIHFAAIAKSNFVELSWTTASETNNDYFSIYRSKNGINFKEVGRVSGAGDSEEELHYKWMDLTPDIGSNYYYLRQTDFDGTFKNFDVKLVDFKSGGQALNLEAYPNPSTGVINLQGFGFGSLQLVIIKISDLSGRVIFDQKVTATTAGTIDTSVEIANSGIYIIKASSFNKEITKRAIIR